MKSISGMVGLIVVMLGPMAEAGHGGPHEIVRDYEVGTYPLGVYVPCGWVVVPPEVQAGCHNLEADGQVELGRVSFYRDWEGVPARAESVRILAIDDLVLGPDVLVRMCVRVQGGGDPACGETFRPPGAVLALPADWTLVRVWIVGQIISAGPVTLTGVLATRGAVTGGFE